MKAKLVTLGQHKGFWISGSKIRTEFRISDGEEMVHPTYIHEDMYLERGGLIFRVFLDDFRNDQFFLEVIS